MSDQILPPIDIGAASGNARQYDAQTAANPDYNFSATLGETLEANANEMVHTGPTAQYRAITAGTSFVGGDDTMSGDQATAEFGIPGVLSWDSGQTVNRAQASVAQDIARTKQQDEFIESRRPATWTGWATAGAGDFLGGAVDPTNIAAQFLPVSWLGRGAEV